MDSSSPQPEPPGPPKRIALTLSGGGFRATLFHLGVVKLLAQTGLLTNVTFISGVSGGSILAAHLGLHWDRYNHPDSFDGAAQEIIRFARSDLRNRLLRRWILGWITLAPRLFFGWSRARLLERAYAQLYGGATNDVIRAREGFPRIIFQTVSLMTGQPCAFGRSGFMWYEEDQERIGVERRKDEERSAYSQQIPLALAVAASSAFPPMFPPVKVTHRNLRVNREQFPRVEYLTDGGVLDNLGSYQPLWYYEQTQDHPDDTVDVFLMSDAEGYFGASVSGAWFKFSLYRNIRATNIMMRRISMSEYLRKRDVRRLSVGIAMDTKEPEVVQAIKRIRTDLDGFSPVEIESLVRHGYRAARKVLADKDWITEDMAADWPMTPDCAGGLRRSSKRKIRGLVAWRDWTTWAIGGVVLGLALLLRKYGRDVSRD